MLGGPEEIRTPNPLHAMEVRYRCATGPRRFTRSKLPKLRVSSKILPPYQKQDKQYLTKITDWIITKGQADLSTDLAVILGIC